MARIASKPRRAVTMIEVLLVMSIISILLGILCVWLQRAREAANYASCQAHLRDLALAVHHYETVRGKMPPYATGRANELFGSWYMHLLPYVGHENLYDYIVTNQSTYNETTGIRIVTSGENLPEIKHAIFPELVCGSDPTRHDVDGNSMTNYVANWYAFSDGVRGNYRHAQPFSSLTNGLANVILFAESYSECEGLPRLALYSARYHNFGITGEGLPSDSEFYLPVDYLMFQDNPSISQCDKWRTQTPHSTMPVALADGSVRSVSASISPHTWRYLVRARDGDGEVHHDW